GSRRPPSSPRRWLWTAPASGRQRSPASITGEWSRATRPFTSGWPPAGGGGGRNDPNVPTDCGPFGHDGPDPVRGRRLAGAALPRGIPPAGLRRVLRRGHRRLAL